MFQYQTKNLKHSFDYSLHTLICTICEQLKGSIINVYILHYQTKNRKHSFDYSLHTLICTICEQLKGSIINVYILHYHMNYICEIHTASSMLYIPSFSFRLSFAHYVGEKARWRFTFRESYGRFNDSFNRGKSRSVGPLWNVILTRFPYRFYIYSGTLHGSRRVISVTLITSHKQKVMFA